MRYPAHLIGLLFVAFVSFLAAWWVRKGTRDRAGSAMVALLAGHGVIGLLAFVQHLGSTLSWHLFWYRAWYLVGIVLPIVWFLLAVYYTGREHWLTKPVWAVILASPVPPVLVWLADPYLGLALVDVTLEGEPFPYLVPEFSGFWLVIYGLIGIYPLFAFGLFLRMFFFPRGHSRWQAGAVLLGIVAIWVTVWLTESALVPAPGFPYVHYGNGIFGTLVAVALFRTRFFAVTPLAHETIFESIDDAILVVDAKHVITDFNETASERFPNLPERVGEPLAKAYPELLAADGDSSADGGGATAIVERIDRSVDAPFAGAIRVSTPDDSRTLRVSVSEIERGGEPRGYALIMRDVTDLERYAIDLEHKTDQLERFAGVLSHDLRNPVSVACGYADLAVETGDVSHVQDVRVALERIDETIEDLLILSQEGDSIADPEAVSLRSLVADAWSTSDTRTLTLVNEVDPEHRLRADPSRLRTLLENLFRNAADHGGETVRVTTLEPNDGSESGRRSEVGFAVSDDGPGIPAAERDRIFEYGYSSSTEGTGLGLSIVTSIASAHGWSVSVTESEDGGARFEISNVEPGYESEAGVDRPAS